jgi:hypothetical protein
MHRGELYPASERNSRLAEIRQFLRIQAENYRYSGERSRDSYRESQAKQLDLAISDFDSGKYELAINFLEAYYKMRRHRADNDPDLDGMPEADTRIANETAQWIDLLKSARPTD